MAGATTIETAYLDRHRLDAAVGGGRLGDDWAVWARKAMDDSGLPDGLPLLFVDGELFEPAWRWQRSMPLATAASTRRRYTNDVRRLVEFLTERGRPFASLTATDVKAYALERSSRTAASTWKVEEAALMSFLRFCTEGDGTSWRVFRTNPWPLWRTARGARSALRRPPDTVPAVPRFLDDDELRWFLVAGVEGRHPTTGEPLRGGPVPAPLFARRDLALAAFLVTTGARIGEARLVLVDEIPVEPARHPWPSVWLRLGGERAKTRGGEVPFDPSVGTLVGLWYRSTERADLVDRAQPRLGGLLRSQRLFVVEETSRASNGELCWLGRWEGRRRRFSATTLTRAAAAAAVRLVDGRIEPLTLWQGPRSGGLPISADAIEHVFAEATLRAAVVSGCPFGEHLKPRSVVRPDGRRRRAGGITAHLLRHSAAVRWMVELEQERRRRDQGAGTRTPGLPPGGFNSLLLVQTWLRHRSHETTLRYQTCYLSRRWLERTLGDGLRLALATGSVHQ